MVRSVISMPMLRQIEADEDGAPSVLIQINVNYAQGRTAAKQRVKDLVPAAIRDTGGMWVGTPKVLP